MTLNSVSNKLKIVRVVAFLLCLIAFVTVTGCRRLNIGIEKLPSYQPGSLWVADDGSVEIYITDVMYFTTGHIKTEIGDFPITVRFDFDLKKVFVDEVYVTDNNIPFERQSRIEVWNWSEMTGDSFEVEVVKTKYSGHGKHMKFKRVSAKEAWNNKYSFVEGYNVNVGSPGEEKYTLEKLRSVVNGRCLCEKFISDGKPPLTLNELNESIPVSYISHGSNNIGSLFYSFFNVAEGGRYYLFWIKELDDKFEIINDDLVLYSVMYINEDRDVSIFNDIKPGASTAADVKRVDPDVEFVKMKSGETISFSKISRQYMMRIDYFDNDSGNGYDSITVASVRPVERHAPEGKQTMMELMDIFEFDYIEEYRLY